jgi:tetratricopeptide (TPR) repeat protein
MAGNEQRFQQAMNQGHSAAWDQDWKEAVNFYKQALKEFPEHPKALTSLALALYQLQDFKSALVYYQTAAKLSPTDAVPFEKAAELLDLTGNPEQAIETRFRAAEVYLQAKDINKAIELWAKVVNHKPDHIMAHSRLALVYEKMGQKQQAMTEYIAIASLLQANGDIPRAVQAATRAQQVHPEHPDPAKVLAMLQSGQRLPRPTRPSAVTSPLTMPFAKPEKETKAGTQPLSNGYDPVGEARQKAMAALAGILFEQEDDDDGQIGRKGFKDLVAGKGSSAQGVDQARVLLFLSQAIDFQTHGDKTKALEELERAVGAGLENPAAYFDVGYLYWELGKLDQAIKPFQSVVGHADYALAVRLLLGYIYHQNEKILEASIEYLEALKLADAQVVAPEYAEELSHLYDPIIEAHSQQTDSLVLERICTNVSEMLLRTDWRTHLSQAREQLPAQVAESSPIPLAELLTESNTSQVVESIHKINQMARMGHYRTAMEEAFFALRVAPTYLPLHLAMADLLMYQEHRQEAVTKYKVIAQSYNARGENSRAITTLRRLVDLAPMDMDVRQQLISLMVARGQLDDAVQEYLRLADIYYSLADLPASREACSKALRITQQPNVQKTLRTKVLHRLADIDLQSMDWRKAIKSFEQIRAIQPDDEQANLSLIEINFRLGQEAQALKELDAYIEQLMRMRQSDQAVQFLQKLISESPKQAGVRRRLAELFRQMDRIPEAIEQLDSAGELLLQSGQRTAAMDVVESILALNPPRASEYQSLLAQIKSGR